MANKGNGLALLVGALFGAAATVALSKLAVEVDRELHREEGEEPSNPLIAAILQQIELAGTAIDDLINPKPITLTFTGDDIVEQDIYWFNIPIGKISLHIGTGQNNVLIATFDSELSEDNEVASCAIVRHDEDRVANDASNVHRLPEDGHTTTVTIRDGQLFGTRWEISEIEMVNISAENPAGFRATIQVSAAVDKTHFETIKEEIANAAA